MSEHIANLHMATPFVPVTAQARLARDSLNKLECRFICRQGIRMKEPGSAIGGSERETLKSFEHSVLPKFALFLPHRYPTPHVVPLSVTCVALMFRHPALNNSEHENKMCRELSQHL